MVLQSIKEIKLDSNSLQKFPVQVCGGEGEERILSNSILVMLTRYFNLAVPIKQQTELVT